MRINFDMFCDLSKIRQREINKNKSSNKLSSGKKVIGAAYDAAGLSISETMKAKIRGLHQAERNATDVISMLQVTDGGLDIISDMLQRMRELSIQSLSDTLTREDRKNIQDEFRELKFQIDQVCKQTNFNTKNLYEEHMPMYHEFSGNRRLGDTVSVISGYNDNLGIKVDGKLVEIVLDEGIYTFEELADMIDDKLFEIDGNIIVSVKENRTLSISAENYKDIEGLTGGAASFFYEYHLGSGGGIVYGSSDLSGRLKIVKDSNDIFSFNVDGKTYNIKFNPSRENDINTWYTAEDIVNTMNEQLKQQNANVKVYMRGNNISIDAGHRTIDGFSGNMIKLDGITSILYDNAKHGRIDKTQGYMRGRVDLSNGVEINEGENDTIRFKIDGGNYKEIKLEPKEYQNISEIANEINNKLNESKIEAYAEIYGNNIKLCSKKLGEGSKVHVDSNSNSYTTFFKREYKEEIVWDPNIVNGKTTTATIEGRYGIGNITKIDEGKNDEITITVDGTEKTIRLDSGEYTVEDLIKNINDQIGELPIEATNENGYIKLVCKNAGSEYRLDNFSGNFYEEVFRKKEIENRIEEPFTKNGGNSYNHDPEAYVVGRKDISQGVVINPNINDELTFNYNHNGKIESISIKLTPGNYSSGELVSEINSKLDEQNIDYVRAQYGGVNTGTTADDSNKLVFKNTKEDNGTYVIDGVSGSSAYSIFYNASNEPTPTHTVGVVDLTEGITIEENENDTFIFDENGEKKELKFAASNYSPEEFLNEVNNKLKNANSKFIASYYDGKLKISYDSVGYNTIENIIGNASKDIFFNSEKREMEDVQRTFQIGANSGENITIAPIRMSTGLLGISTLTLENRKSSEKALRRLDSAILTISQNRSKVGAYENRMEHTIRNIENYSENLQASESRITDLDMAKETMEFVKQNVLSEVSTAILAQSNINVKKIAELILGQ